MTSIDASLKANAAYATEFRKGDLEAPPQKKLVVITCMDARIETGAALGIEEGDAHVIRNAGGIVTDDTIRSLMISQHLLGTEEVMVVQHTDCGMMKFDDEELAETIHRETAQRPPQPLGTFRDLEANIRTSLTRLAASPFVKHTHSIRGFVYDVSTGRLREVGGG